MSPSHFLIFEFTSVCYCPSFFVHKLHCPIADLLPTVDATLNKFVGDQKKKCDRAYIV